MTLYQSPVLYSISSCVPLGSVCSALLDVVASLRRISALGVTVPVTANAVLVIISSSAASRKARTHFLLMWIIGTTPFAHKYIISCFQCQFQRSSFYICFTFAPNDGSQIQRQDATFIIVYCRIFVKQIFANYFFVYA